MIHVTIPRSSPSVTTASLSQTCFSAQRHWTVGVVAGVSSTKEMQGVRAFTARTRHFPFRLNDMLLSNLLKQVHLGSQSAQPRVLSDEVF